jgi:4'-phosphopantetheinyl transferase
MELEDPRNCDTPDVRVVRAEVSSWSSSPAPFTLSSDEIHIWRVNLNQPAAQVEKFLDTLASDERDRAERFHFVKDRKHFIVARGFLRFILGCYLKTNAGQLRFCYGPYGKPALNGEQRHSEIRFNLSHSHGLALYAVTCGREIGVDIEYVRADFASEQIARNFFSPQEVEALCAVPSEARVRAFFNCWTRKEAYIKATGRGLSQSLDSFDVSLAPGEPAALLRNEENPKEAALWSLHELKVENNYAAAIAVEGHGFHIRCWQGLS